MKKILLSAAIASLAMNVDAQTRIPLFEVFSSSTCGPCKNGNIVYKGVIDKYPSTEYVSIKYQQNFPGSGDPYCTDETVYRRSTYYAINSIPRMEIDGGWDKNAGSFDTATYKQYKNIAPKFVVEGVYTLNVASKTINAKVKYRPLASATLTGNTLHVVIVESQCDNNVKSNGETVFYDVVKKMLPNHTGTALSGLAVGKTDSTVLNFQFKGNYRLPADGTGANRINHATEHSVEDFNNLKVVAWVQNSSKEVYQAANLLKVSSLDINDIQSISMNDVTLYPNPASDFVNMDINMKSADKVKLTIANMAGQVIATQDKDMNVGENSILINTSNFAAGVYNVILMDSQNNSVTRRLTVVR